MILLDTHIWIWWVAQDARLPTTARKLIADHKADGLGVSIISCWEVAKKVEVGKLVLDRGIREWIDGALSYPGVTLLGLTPEVVVESTRLPGPFHRDPADQMIVATARVLGIPLLTNDSRILAYRGIAALGN
ncbi:MAG: type II toxin-antitoxin system VapC family toxin [Dehalococcoidia bacterium]|nr:type II toxin-antitoxin system VapC family toxin [Dehalococcoidia bacterium]